MAGEIFPGQIRRSGSEMNGSDMRLNLNGSEIEIDSRRLVDLLHERQIDITKRGVAVAVNDTVIPRARWEEHLLEEGDRVEIVTAMQGG